MSGSTDSSVNSLYPQAQPQGQGGANSLLGMVGQFAQTQNAMNQNLQFQQQYAARQALGPILQQAVGPDGTLDYNKAFVGMAQNPATAWMAGDFLNQAVTRQQTQADTALKQLQLHTTLLGNGINAISPLLAQGDNVSSQDVIGALAQAKGEGIIDNNTAMGIFNQLPAQQGPALASHLKALQLQMMDSKQRADTVYGSIVNNNVGGAIVPTRQSSFMNTSNTVGGNANSLPMTPTPGEYYQGVSGVGPNGQQTLGPQGPALGMPAPGSIPGFNGAPSSAQGAQNAPGVQTALPSTYADYLGGKGPMADYEQNLNETTSKVLPLLQNYKEMTSLVGQLGQGGAGVGAETRTQLANIARAAGAGTGLVNAIQGGSADDALTASQELMKYMTRNAVSTLAGDIGSAGKMTGGEVDKYLSSGSPNLSMTPQAIQGLNNFMQTLAEQKLVEQQEFNRYKGTTAPDGTFTPSKAFESNPNSWNNIWSQYMARSGRINLLTNAAKNAFEPQAQQ